MAQTSANVVAGNDAKASEINKIVADIAELYSGSGIPIGGVIHFWSDNTVPPNYALCDGNSISDPDSPMNGLNTPNLINRFIRGVVNANIRSSVPTGGADTHNHGGATAGHAITTAQMPSHNHGITDPGHQHNLFINIFNTFQAGGGTIVPERQPSFTPQNSWMTNAQTGITINNNGSGQQHSHNLSTDNNIPAWTGLVPIVRIK